MKKIVFLLPEQANIASLENARQGFAAANDYLVARGRPAHFDICTVGATPEVSLDEGRIVVYADATLDDPRTLDADLCIVPPLSGSVARAVERNMVLVKWLGQHVQRGGELACLCLGAALPAAAGVLDGQQAVVHWAARDDYARAFPNVDWVSDSIVLAGRGIYTSGGAFSAAHLVLYLIEKYCDRDTAIWCAKYFQLDWSRQSQLPFAVFNGRKSHPDEAVLRVQAYIEGHFSERITVEELAERFFMGRRTLERRFREATDNSVVEYVQRVRVEAAKTQLERSRKTVAEVMYEVGYNDIKAFRDVFNKYCGVSPLGYRETYQ